MKGNSTTFYDTTQPINKHDDSITATDLRELEGSYEDMVEKKRQRYMREQRDRCKRLTGESHEKTGQMQKGRDNKEQMTLKEKGKFTAIIQFCCGMDRCISCWEL